MVTRASEPTGRGVRSEGDGAEARLTGLGSCLRCPEARPRYSGVTTTIATYARRSSGTTSDGAAAGDGGVKIRLHTGS